MRFVLISFFVLTVIAWLQNPVPAYAQQLLDVQTHASDGKPRMLAFFPTTSNAGELVLFDETGHRLLTRAFPFSLRAVCIGKNHGFIVAPTTGGLLYLDERMRVKIQIPGYVYETLACTVDTIYAAGRTTRIYQFDFPNLLHRQIAAEVDSFVPRIIATNAAIVAVSWDGSAVIIGPNPSPLRLYVSHRSLIGLTGAPNSWIALTESHRIMFFAPNGVTGYFQVEDARMLATSPQGILAVMNSNNEIFFYRRAKMHWIAMRRHSKLPDSLKPIALAYLTGHRWVVLTSSSITIFETPH